FHVLSPPPSPRALRSFPTRRSSDLPAWAVIPFAIAGAFWPPLWATSVFAAAFFAASLTFHVGGAIYHLELYPWIALAAAAGFEMAVRGTLPLRRPLALAACALLALPAGWTALRAVSE